MADIRFTLIGVVLIFVGFMVLGVFGDEYRAATVESDEFGSCYYYSDNAEPVKVSCDAKIGEQMAFFGLVVAFIGAGVVALIKGIRGDWDSRVRPEEMLGPTRRGYDDDASSGDGRDSDEQNRDTTR